MSAQNVYEGFTDYANEAEVLAVNGGTGFSSPWTSRQALFGNGANIPGGSYSLLPDSLGYTDVDGRQLTTAGGSLFLTGMNGNVHFARPYDLTALPNTDPDPQIGKTTYLSFLARRSGEAADPTDPVYGGSYPFGTNLYPRAAGVNFFSNDGGDAVQLFLGGVSNAEEDIWRLRGQDLDGVSKDPRIEEPFGAGNLTYFVVMRIDHGEGDGNADEINLYLNPRLEAELLNTVGTTADWETRDDPLYLPGDWFGLEAGDASGNRPYAEFTFDEYRIGQTWADVTPFTVIPEPALAGLVLGLVAGLLGLRRRR